MPPRSRACEELVTAVATRLEPRVEEIAERLIDRVVAEMDLPREDEDLREDLLAAARGSVALLTVMARSWTDPHIVPAPQDALTWARGLVARGLPIDALLRVYRIGQSGYHALWHEELVASGAPAAVVLEALNATTAFIFTWIDAISAPLVEAYEDERLRRLGGSDAVRAETVAALLAGEALDVATAGARLGYDLERPHVALVAWAPTQAPDAARDGLEALAGELAEALSADGGRPLLLREDARTLTAWVPRPRPVALEPLAVLARARGARVALGGSGDGVAGFRSSHDEAQRARRVARLVRQGSPVVRYPDVAVLDLLTRDVAQARRVARATLGPLAADDDATRRLLATLRVYLQEGESFARTARRLGVHENTVSYRVRRAFELAGAEHASALRAVVDLVPLLHDAPPPDL
ncbi:PucR family transcriptional regulator [Paraconexibacter algicola]|uniref:PucR family transcriptional regulator n=1 Tax=Paraconexibacter algicola TaxID=2133960 RepID=A0A2T4UJS7_9ACTN|nr:helix-turn-helix domain-containing protein [Paraconexibacter algicola]PTL59475.1 hypothetical protein C7Y72_07340 [Paraconexibacter algicola]